MSDQPFMRVELTGDEWMTLVGAIGVARVGLRRDVESGQIPQRQYDSEMARLDAVSGKLSDHRAMVADGVL